VAWAAREPSGPVGFVTGVVGIDVELRRSDMPAQFVQLGLPLRTGDEIHVPAEQSVMLFLPSARTVLQVHENAVVTLRSVPSGFDLRVSRGFVRASSNRVHTDGVLVVSTPLAQCRMVAAVLEVEHQAGETAGASRSVFALSTDRTDASATVRRVGSATSAPLSAGRRMVVAPGKALGPASAEPSENAPFLPEADWGRKLPLSAARTHRLRVVDNFRNDMVQRTALAAVLAQPTRVAREAPQSIVDQPAVQPPGPTQVTRITTPTVSSAPTFLVDSGVNQLARQNLTNLLGLVPGRGPTPTGGPNSLINAQR